VQIENEVKIGRNEWQAECYDYEGQQQYFLTDRHFAALTKATAAGNQQKAKDVFRQKIKAE
jgi:hypothetical protein